MARDQRIVSARELLAQRNVLIALAAALAQEEPGGVLSVGLDVLLGNMTLCGGLAYRFDGRELLLVSDRNLPRKAHAWLKHLTLGEEDPWFVAQRVVPRVRSEVDTELAKARAGVSIAPILREAGWHALAAVPAATGRHVKGVVVVAADGAERFDRESLRVLEAAASIMALALAREEQRERESERLAETATVQLATVGLVATSMAEDLHGPLRTLERQLDHHRRLIEAGIDDVRLEELAQLGREMEVSMRGARELTQRLAVASDDSHTTLDFAGVTRSAVSMMSSHAQAHEVEVELSGGDEELAVDGREAELFMLVVQLLMHAVRRCEGTPDARVVLTLEAEEERVSLRMETTKRSRSTKKSGIELFEALMARGGAADIERIGLSLARQTVLAHHGHVEVGRSELGGVQIRAVLPRSRHSLPGEPVAPIEPIEFLNPGVAARRVVIWIDEDPVWIGAVQRYLDGHEVHTAESLDEGRQLLGQLGDAAEAIFAAVVLPDGSGLDLHREAPHAVASRFVFVCDGVLSLEAAAYMRGTGCPTLIKPLTLEELSALLDERQLEHGRISGVPTLHPPISSRPPERTSEPPSE